MAKHKKQVPLDIKKLLKLGKDRGFVTQEEILQVFPQPEDTIAELDQFFTKLINDNIDVFETILSHVIGKYGMYVVAPIPHPKTKEMLDMKCLYQNCTKDRRFRGLCPSCYYIAVRLIKNKQTSWEKLESQGKSLPKVLPGRNSRSSDIQRWFLDDQSKNYSAGDPQGKQS